MRIRLAAVLGGTALLVAALGAAPATAAPGSVLPNASTAHPFSDPVWFPLASAAEMGCVKNNPGCPPSGIQTYWNWDLQGANQPAGEYHQKVYAMGAGIVHVLFKNKGCGGSGESRGNTIYIDHGAGVISMYSHLADTFLVHDGDYVSARTAIGYVGNSGYRKCVENPNTRFLAIVVMHHAKPTKNGHLTGDYEQVKHTYTCVSGHKVDWPKDLFGNDGTWTRWYHVPVNTAIPNTSDSRPCVNTPPATAPYPHNATLTKSASTTLRAGWKQPGSGYHVSTVLVQLQQFHSSVHAWTDLTAQTVNGGVTSTHFTHLTHNGDYRVKVWFKNGVGWSKSTKWIERVLN